MRTETRWLSAACVALVGLFAGCTWGGASSETGTPTRDRPSVSTTTICNDPNAITRRVRAFIAAYDAGENGLADRFIAPASEFRWYSENGLRQGSAAYDRSTLDAYLTQRWRDGDRLELVSVTPSSGGNFAFTVRHGAGEPVLSKAAIDCRTGLFVVWSLGPNPGP